MEDMTTRLVRGTAGGRALRPIVVIRELPRLQGPVSGVHQLPLHLDSSAREWFDFADPHRRSLAYRLVLTEASSDDDLTQWLNHNALVEVWSELYLPPPVRRTWESHHPELAARGAGPDVPAA